MTLAVAVLLANVYLPLRTGDVALFDYRFHVEATSDQFRAPETNGKMTVWTEGTDEKHGKTWTRFRTTYRDIPYMKTAVFTWRREENGDVWMGSEAGGRWSETLELPADVSVGREWDYDDGEPSRRKVVRKLDVVVAGRTVSGCIEVARAPLRDDRKNVTQTNVYCPDLGEVKFRLEATSPMGTYVTETSLSGHTKAP